MRASVGIRGSKLLGPGRSAFPIRALFGPSLEPLTKNLTATRGAQTSGPLWYQAPAGPHLDLRIRCRASQVARR